MKKSVLVLGLFALVLSACDWPMIGGGPSLNGFNNLESKITTGNVNALAEVWSAPFATTTGPVSQPVSPGLSSTSVKPTAASTC